MRGHADPRRNTDARQHGVHVGAQDHHDQNDIHGGGDGVQDILEAHHDQVDTAADVTGNTAVDNADDQVDEGGAEADGKADAGAVADAGEMSRPNLSVPKKCSAQGAALRMVRSWPS